ncbi:MAG: hypothetical protein ACRD09_10650 [Vicinamibacterales bacterium]
MQTNQVRVQPDATIFVRRAALVAAAIAFVSVAAAQPAPSQAEVQSKRRYQVRVMEGALVGAVSHGAGQVSRQLQPVGQNLLFLSGAARARGFALDGYGLFFDVEIPAMRESVVSIMRTLEPDFAAARRMFEQLQREVQRVSDPREKTALDQTVRKLEALMVSQGARQGRGDDNRPVTSAEVAEPARGGLAASAVAAPAPPVPIADPNLLYTETVKDALVDAMLEYGGVMALQADEWLTVAARDAEGPLTPAENYDPATLILRVKGSDLAAFQARRMTLEEARKRVEVRQF